MHPVFWLFRGLPERMEYRWNPIYSKSLGPAENMRVGWLVAAPENQQYGKQEKKKDQEITSSRKRNQQYSLLRNFLHKPSLPKKVQRPQENLARLIGERFSLYKLVCKNQEGGKLFKPQLKVMRNTKKQGNMAQRNKINPQKLTIKEQRYMDYLINNTK